jgi:hypothetical protein
MCRREKFGRMLARHDRAAVQLCEMLELALARTYNRSGFGRTVKRGHRADIRMARDFHVRYDDYPKRVVRAYRSE